MIIVSTTEKTRRLLRSYVPSDGPYEMLEAILRLNNEKNTQNFIASFYTLHQSINEMTDEFSVKLHATFEEIVKAQI